MQDLYHQQYVAAFHGPLQFFDALLHGTRIVCFSLFERGGLAANLNPAPISSVYICIYVSMYICIYAHIYIYIHTYIQENRFWISESAASGACSKSWGAPRSKNGRWVRVEDS